MWERVGPDIEHLGVKMKPSSIDSSMSDPPLSDINFKNKMVWVCTTLNYDRPSNSGQDPTLCSKLESMSAVPSENWLC